MQQPVANHPLVEAQSLCKEVNTGTNKFVILQDIHLSINAGDSLAIIGRSGAGKTTLLSLLAGLDLPTRGEVRLQGQSLSTLTEEARTELRGTQLGFVFQSFHLLPHFNALENIMLPLELQQQTNARDRAMTCLQQVGLSARQTHYPKQLSGGEQQRVAIARAIAHRPAILFADEPTGNLDSNTGQAIMDLLFTLNREGTTLVIITHDQQIANACQRQIQIADGKLIASQ